MYWYIIYIYTTGFPPHACLSKGQFWFQRKESCGGPSFFIEIKISRVSTTCNASQPAS